jgi:hypothetical protein
MIHQTPPTTPARAETLAKLDALRAELGSEVGRAAPWDGRLRRLVRNESAAASLSIEGFADASSPDVNLAVDPADDQDRWAHACYARAMHHVAVMASDDRFVWNERAILDLHFDACIFQQDKSPGQWRTGPMLVTRPAGGYYTAPDAAEALTLMEEVVAWMNHGEPEAHVAVRAAMAHLHVVSVHPFRDGNGRVARLVQSLVLGLDGLLSPDLASIEPFLARDTDRYYRELIAVQGTSYSPTLDASSWVDYCLEAHLWQGKARLDLVRAAGRRWRALESIVDERGWPDRLVIALDQALTGGVDRASYIEQSGVSAPTASGDFRRLADAQLLTQQGAGRSTRYVASTQLRERLLSDSPS